MLIIYSYILEHIFYKIYDKIIFRVLPRIGWHMHSLWDLSFSFRNQSFTQGTWEESGCKINCTGLVPIFTVQIIFILHMVLWSSYSN